MDKLTLKSIEKCSEILEGEIFECNDTECVVLSDAEECYREGYKDAINDAIKILNDDFLYIKTPDSSVNISVNWKDLVEFIKENTIGN